MRRFSGQGGDLFISSDPYCFSNLPLEDCGSGFDWRAEDPAMRYWIAEGEFSFETYEGERWKTLTATKIHYVSGRVEFERCPNGPVRANGVCLPLTLLARANKWFLTVAFKARDTSVLTKEDRETAIIPLGSVANVLGVDINPVYEPVKKVVAMLPTATGAFVGAGEIVKQLNNLTINFDENGVCYGPV